MKKLFYILPVLFLLLLGSCRSDEPFKWNNREVRDDEYILAFIRSDYSSIRDTRSVEPAKAPLLLIFESDGVDAQIKKVVDLSNYTVTKNGEINSVTLKQSDVQAGHWLLVQNFGVDKIVDAVPTKTDIYTVTLAEFNAIKFNIPTTESDAMVYRSELRAINPADLKQAESENVDVFELKKPSVKVSLIMNTDQIPFIVTGVDLYYQPQYVQMGAEMQTALKDLGEDHMRTCTDADKTNEIANTFTDKNGAEKLGLRYGKALSFYAAPIANEGLTLEGGTGNEKGLDAPYLIVKGYVADKDENDNWVYDFSGDELFFAKKLPAIPANSHLQASITGSTVTGGSRTRAAAVENPVGLNIEFKVESDRHESIVSDGENALAVTDSIKIGHEGSTVNDVIHIKVRTRYNKDELQNFLKIRHGDYSYLLHSNAGNKIPAGWCFLQEPGFENPDADDNSFYNYDLTLRVDAGKNEGSARNEKISVLLYTEKDFDGKFLSRDVVIFQDKDDDNTADKVFSVKAEGSLEAANYLSFIGSNGKSATAEGTLPDDNDGRVRNNGLHIPYHYTGDATVTYTVSINDAIDCDEWKLNIDGDCGITTTSATGSTSSLAKGTSWTFTATEDNTKEYTVYPEAIKLTVIKDNTPTEYSLDVYRTGFFHQNHYYEVMQEGTTGRYWLDRNWGATSAGMAVNNNGTYMSDTVWPLKNGSGPAGGFYNNESDLNLPKLWRIPTIAEMTSLTSAAGFNITQARTVSSKSPYYCPTYGFAAKTGNTSQIIRSYFPLAMMKAGGAVAGTSANGYYLTQTEDGENDGSMYYQVLQFDGLNATALSLEMKKAARTVSLRPCSGTTATSQGVTYILNVKGYTHVYVYGESAAGRRTVLTSWPGEQIAVCNAKGEAGTMDRYNTMTITSPVAYDKMYIICNVVGADGKRFTTKSNVSEADVAARKGVQVIFTDELSATIEAPAAPVSLTQVASMRKITDIVESAARKKAVLARHGITQTKAATAKKSNVKKAGATRANITRTAYYHYLLPSEEGYTTEYRNGTFEDYIYGKPSYEVTLIGGAIDIHDKQLMTYAIVNKKQKCTANFEIEPGVFHIKVAELIDDKPTGTEYYYYASGTPAKYTGNAIEYTQMESKTTESGTQWESTVEGLVSVVFYPEDKILQISDRKVPHYHLTGMAITGDREKFLEMNSDATGTVWTLTTNIISKETQGTAQEAGQFKIQRFYQGDDGVWSAHATIWAADDANINIYGNGTYQGQNISLGGKANFVSHIDAENVTFSYNHVTRKLTISGAPNTNKTVKFIWPDKIDNKGYTSLYLFLTDSSSTLLTGTKWPGSSAGDPSGGYYSLTLNNISASTLADLQAGKAKFILSQNGSNQDTTNGQDFKSPKVVALSNTDPRFSGDATFLIYADQVQSYSYYLDGPAFGDESNDSGYNQKNAQLTDNGDGTYSWTGKPKSGKVFGIRRYDKDGKNATWIGCTDANKSFTNNESYSTKTNGSSWTNNITTNATFTFTPNGTDGSGTLKVVAEAQLKELGFRWYPIMSKFDGGSYSFESLGNHIYAQLNNGNDYWMESGNGLTGTIQEEGYYLATTDNTGELKQISWGGSVDYSDSNHWRKASAEDAKKCGVKVLYDIRKQTTSYKNLNFIYWINRLSGASRDYTGGIDLYDGDFVTGGTLHRNNAVQMSTSKMYYYVAATITIDNGGTIVLRNSSDDTKVMQFANHTKERSDIAWFVGAQTAIQITSVNEISDESDNNRSSRSVSVTHKKMPALSPAAQAAAAKARKR